MTSKTYTQPFGLVCAVGQQNTFAIDYIGDILKCTLRLYDDINKVGNIFTGEFNLAKLSKFVSAREEEKCIECKIYPICYGKKCPAGENSEE